MLARSLSVFLALAAALPLAAQNPDANPNRGDEAYPRIHDPSTVVAEKDGLWCLSTGMGVPLLKREPDGRWKKVAAIFKEYPAWQRREVPENRGHLWAPDIIRLGDRWFVYYSVSSFGSNESAIGLVSGKTLDPGSPDYGWRDEGLVLRSRRDDRFNAIDPAVMKDGDRLWLSYGSFWDGIFLVELDPATGLRKDPAAKPAHLAKHSQIEAPFLCRHGDFCYLFVNWGLCCRGADSTYEIRVGRSREVGGPYLDREGVDLRKDGGSLVLATEGRFIGPGHASILVEQGREMLVHHFYDKDRKGRSDLRMLPLSWQDGWPVVGELEMKNEK